MSIAIIVVPIGIFKPVIIYHMNTVMKRKNYVAIAVVLGCIFLFAGCVSFGETMNESSSSQPEKTEEEEKHEIIEKKYSDDPYKDEIMRLFAYNGINVKESSIKRVANWAHGYRYEVPVKKGTAIVYYDGLKLVAIRDKSDLHYIYGRPSYY